MGQTRASAQSHARFARPQIRQTPFIGHSVEFCSLSCAVSNSKELSDADSALDSSLDFALSRLPAGARCDGFGTTRHLGWSRATSAAGLRSATDPRARLHLGARLLGMG